MAIIKGKKGYVAQKKQKKTVCWLQAFCNCAPVFMSSLISALGSCRWTSQKRISATNSKFGVRKLCSIREKQGASIRSCSKNPIHLNDYEPLCGVAPPPLNVGKPTILNDPVDVLSRPYHWQPTFRGNQMIIHFEEKKIKPISSSGGAGQPKKTMQADQSCVWDPKSLSREGVEKIFWGGSLNARAKRLSLRSHTSGIIV